MKSTNIASGSTFGRLTVVACAAPSKRHGDAQGGDGASADLQPGASRAARTERGYRKTREALEKGAAEHAAAEAK